MISVGKLYRIGELSKIANVSKRTIDYYTQIGLLKAERSDSNYRYYSTEAVERLHFIEIFKQEKLSLEEIKERLEVMHTIRFGNEFSERIHHIHQQMRNLEFEVLQLKPLLLKLNANQLKLLTKHIVIQGTSLYETLRFLFGEDPPFL